MRITRLLSAICLTALAGSLTGGCVDNRATLYVDHVIAQDPGEGECDTSPTGDKFLSQGLYDPLSGSSYIAQLAIANQMAPLGDNDVLRAETSRIQLTGAVIGMTSPNGGTNVPKQTVPFSGTVSPEDSSDPGFISAPVALMTAEQNLADGTYLVSIELRGTTLGGKKIKAGEFVFPIVVQRGSLPACGASYDDLIDAGAVDPCGRIGQDVYRYPCPDSGTESCRQACPSLP